MRVLNVLVMYKHNGTDVAYSDLRKPSPRPVFVHLGQYHWVSGRHQESEMSPQRQRFHLGRHPGRGSHLVGCSQLIGLLLRYRISISENSDKIMHILFKAENLLGNSDNLGFGMQLHSCFGICCIFDDA